MIARPHSSSPSPTPGNQKFPRKLHQMLDTAERNRIDHIASWLPCGRAFAIYNQEEFFNSVMPIYFPRMKSYKSFRRQLNLYGIYIQQRGDETGREAKAGKFSSINSLLLRHQKGVGRSGCIYAHPFMVRGDIKLCQYLTRKQQPSSGAKADIDIDSDGYTLAVENEFAPCHREPNEGHPFPNKKSPTLPLNAHGEGHSTNMDAALLSPTKKGDRSHIGGAFSRPLVQAINILQVSSNHSLDTCTGTLGALRTETYNMQSALQKEQNSSESKKDPIIFSANNDDILTLNDVDKGQQFVKNLEVELRYSDDSPTVTDDTNANGDIPSTLLPTPTWWKSARGSADTHVHSTMTNSSSFLTVPTTIEEPCQLLPQSNQRKVYPTTWGNETLCAALLLFDSGLGLHGPALSREEQEDIENEIILTFVGLSQG